MTMSVARNLGRAIIALGRPSWTREVETASHEAARIVVSDGAAQIAVELHLLDGTVKCRVFYDGSKEAPAELARQATRRLRASLVACEVELCEVCAENNK